MLPMSPYGVFAKAILAHYGAITKFPLLPDTDNSLVDEENVRVATDCTLTGQLKPPASCRAVTHS
jgi:hypothetical protein